MNIDTIFAEANCETWKERLLERSCSSYEAECALRRASLIEDSGKLKGESK